jgi:hypothetical protein
MGISRARVDAASGKTADARTLLESVSQEATALGFRGYELQARYALGEIETSHGDRATGRARLAAVVNDAERLGYKTIAQAAAKAGR